jgi:hypothetical protein
VSRQGDDCIGEMSEVEVLLNVDAGRIPPGTLVFVARDREAPTRILFAFLAVALAGLAVALAVAGGAGREVVVLIGLFAGILGVSALPSTDPSERPILPATLVVTQRGMIARDAWGLRSWRFDDLVEVRPFVHERRVGLLVVRRDGVHDFIDSLAFERGDSLREVIGPRLKARAT